MKKSIVLLAVLAMAGVAYPQGQVNFNNRVNTANPPIFAPISYGTGGPMTNGLVNPSATATLNGYTYGGGAIAGSTVGPRAALYGGHVNATEADMVLLVPAVGFSTGAKAGLVNVGTSGTRTFSTGYAVGTKAWVQVRAWDSGEATAPDSFETAALRVSGTHGVYLGKSAILQVTLGGDPGTGDPIVAVPNLVDERTATALAPFTMDYVIVPEPSIIGLGILGSIAGLMVFRRRS